MQEKLKNINGITLVALIITVIILLILAGVTISLLIGDNGMVTKTKQGVEESEMASIKEKAELVRNEQGIRNFEENPQELTKSSYINALNVSFEDSIVEGSRVIVKDKKYAIFVKSNLEVEVIKNDGKTLAEGEMKLDYTVSEDGLIEIYPRIGGVESYKLYAEKILEGKTQGEKEQILLEGWKYIYPEGFANVFGEKENPTFDDWVNIRNASIENEEEKISKEKLIEELILDSEVNSFDEVLIKEKFVKPEGFDFEKYYNEIKITCPDGSQKNTNTISLGITYQVYKKGEYKFIGNVTDGEYKGISAETIVPVYIDESTYERLALKLEIKIDEDNKRIQLPTNNPFSCAYNCEVDWGDGKKEEIHQKQWNSNIKKVRKLASLNNVRLAELDINVKEHTYEISGTYTITIKGKYEGFCVDEDNESMKKALIKVKQWGETGLKKIDLEDCRNLKEIASPSKKSFSRVREFKSTFSGCVGLTSLPEDLFANCPYIECFESTFSGCTSLTTIPQELFGNCPNANNFQLTFSGCSNLTGKSIQLWKEGRKKIDENNGGAGCYAYCEKLDDYNEIPSYWKDVPPPT